MMADYSSSDFLDMWEYHPQLREKMLIDLLNGSEITRDHLRCKTVERPLFDKLWQLVSGNDSRRQYAIDINFATGLETVTIWLQDIQAFQAESDLAIAATARKLVEARDLLGAELVSVRSEISRVIDLTNSRLDQLTERIALVEARNHAYSQLALEVQGLSAGKIRSVSWIGDTYLVIDRLWWGAYGRYCRQIKDKTELRSELEISSFKIGEAVACSHRLDPTTLSALGHELEHVSRMTDADRLAVAFTLTVPDSCRMPVVTAISRAAVGQPHSIAADTWLPAVASPIGLCRRLLHENYRLSDCL